MRIVAWMYDVDIHCPEHALARFGAALNEVDTVDSEGNPLHPIYNIDEGAEKDANSCSECIAERIARRNRR